MPKAIPVIEMNEIKEIKPERFFARVYLKPINSESGVYIRVHYIK